MKRKIIAGLIFAGVLGISGTALADVNIHIDFGSTKYRPVAKTQTQKQRPPEPPEGFQRDKRPPMSHDRPPMPPRSGDRRPPEFDGRSHNRNNNR